MNEIELINGLVQAVEFAEEQEHYVKFRLSKLGIVVEAQSNKYGLTISRCVGWDELISAKFNVLLLTVGRLVDEINQRLKEHV